MGTWDVRLLSASYCQDGDDIAVELFGKTRDKKSITILYYGFNPYFFVVDPKDNLGPMMRRDKDVVGIDNDRLLYRGEMLKTESADRMSTQEVGRYMMGVREG